MENQTELNISIPEGYEIDKEQSTFEKIIFKKKEQEVKTWEDLIGKDILESSVFIDDFSNMSGDNFCPEGYSYENRNLFIDSRHAKSALAMAQISQLMPYYGDKVTDKEWANIEIDKYVILRYGYSIDMSVVAGTFSFLAFHTREQRTEFLKYNLGLVKDYLMID